MIKINIKTSSSRYVYSDAMQKMHDIHKSIVKKECTSTLWFLEHENCYTIGNTSSEGDILSRVLPVYNTNRGGQVTYHGHGQIICYVMLDLSLLQKDLIQYIRFLEQWVINSLAVFGIHGFTINNQAGVWVKVNNQEYKIAYIGVRISKWVTYHGFSLNFNPNLDYFQHIIPCGLHNSKNTSILKLNSSMQYKDVISTLIDQFKILLTKNYNISCILNTIR